MLDVWKNLFMEVVDKHAPIQNKRVSNKHSPWITYELPRKIYKRNYMKKIAIQEKSTTAWERYKQARNEVNNAIKSAKKQYFTHNLEVNKMNPRKTWKLIDDLSSRKYGRVRNISEIKVNNEPISSAAEMAEVFNDFLQLLDQIWQVKYNRQPLSQWCGVLVCSHLLPGKIKFIKVKTNDITMYGRSANL